MHITAFTPAIQALLEDNAVTARGLPMVFCNVDQLPLQLTVPIVLSLWAEAGEDLDPHFYIVARDPDGERRGAIEHAWHWPDPPDKPYKFSVFADYLELSVPTDGIYKVGLYNHPEQTETEFWFPLEVCVSPQAPPPEPPPFSIASPTEDATPAEDSPRSSSGGLWPRKGGGHRTTRKDRKGQA